jgi:hypothetical protein
MIRFYTSLYVLIAAVYLLSASGRIGLSDGVAMFNVSQSLVNEGTLSSEPCDPESSGQPNHCVPGVDGRYYAGFGLVPSLLASPAELLGRQISAFVHISPSGVSRVMVSIFTALVSPLACVVLAMWIVRLGYSRSTAIMGAGILAFASPFWHFGVKGFYSEPYTALALVLAAYLLSSPQIPHSALISGLAFGLACGCRINTVILFPVFILAICIHIRTRGLRPVQFLRESALFTASFSVCAFLIGLANYMRFGSPLKTGYHLAYSSASQMFSTPLFHGISELLFNGEVGLLIFVPWILVALFSFSSFARAHRAESLLCGASFLFTFLFFAKYDSWHAGRVAGPRFLTPTLPFLVMAIVPFIEKLRGRRAVEHLSRPLSVLRSAMVIVVIGAAAVQCFGALFPEDRYYELMALYGDQKLIGFYGETPDTIGLYRAARVRPWWVNSIPLASIDFVAHLGAADARSEKPVDLAAHDRATVALQETQIRAGMTAAKTEADFLRAFPNSENMTLPNLMVVKLRLLGIPASAAFAYCVFAVIFGGIGLFGLKRYAAPEQELYGDFQQSR